MKSGAIIQPKTYYLFFRKNKYICSKCEKIFDTPKRSGDVKLPRNNPTFSYFESIEKLDQKRIFYLTLSQEKFKLIEKPILSISNIN